jgi:glycosyltransferase involved in cell wall biosynthesis
MNDRERLLFVTPWPPFGGRSGGQIVSEALLVLYAERFEVDLIEGVDPAAEAVRPSLPQRVHLREEVPLKLQFGQHVLYNVGIGVREWIRGRSLRAGKLATRSMRHAVAVALGAKHYHFVHIDKHLMVDILPPGLAVPTVLAAQDVEADVLERLALRGRTVLHRLAARIERQAVVRAEASALNRGDAILAMSDRDADVFARQYGIARQRIVAVYPSFEGAPPGPESPPPQRGVLLLGSLASPGRSEGVLWFLEEVWPIVYRTMPDARLNIAGVAAPPSIRAHDGRRGVAVLGFVATLEPLLRATRVIGVPLRSGAGIRVKIIEMMWRGLPVVSTTVGTTGLLHETRKCIEIEDSPEGFARATVRLLADDEAWIARSHEALQHARQAYSRTAARKALFRALDVAREHARVRDT